MHAATFSEWMTVIRIHADAQWERLTTQTGNRDTDLAAAGFYVTAGVLTTWWLVRLVIRRFRK